ncbi:unnamed protein product [Phaedon cochleariae]|uniref:Dynein axonemal intermediate chain 4 n=1 Tax=Phaedon cochleariae TaxID=80249 RepID=A0A9P0DMQ8_PHACE|nr:unnamed protein product [Phaedon cochleariae]
MFGTKHNECVGYESTWKVKKVSSEGSTQTTEFAVADKGSNTMMKSEIEVQTEDEPTKQVSEVDMDKLANWLTGIYPSVRKELNEASNSHAFRGYQLQGDSKDAECKLLQSLKVSNAISNRVVALSWNQTGKTLALSCNFEHKSWCHHTGFVAVYTFTRDDKLPDLPSKKFLTDNCVSSVEFHPIHPAILAAATLSGSIVVWNIRNEDGEEIVASVTNAHEDAIITQLAWVNDVDIAKSLLIATSGTDGLLKMWRFNPNSSEMNLKVRYKMKPPILSHTQRNINKDQFSGDSTRAVTCFDFSKHIHDMFVVALEGGHVVQCSVLGTTELKGSTTKEPLADPSFKYYEPHNGEITRVCFSPNRSEMFMTSGTDQEVRIYIIGQEDPAKIIFVKHPLNDVTFVYHEEKLIAGCGTNGFLEIFHIQKKKSFENLTDKKVLKSTASTTISVNRKRTNMVVMGNVNGELQLWSVPWLYLAMK